MCQTFAARDGAESRLDGAGGGRAVGGSAGRARRQAFFMGPVSRFTAMYFDQEVSEDEGEISREEHFGPVEVSGGEGGRAGPSGGPVAAGGGDRGKHEGFCMFDGGRRGWGEIASRAQLEAFLEETLKLVAEQRAAEQVSELADDAANFRIRKRILA